MTWTHWHLALNHVPVMGVPFLLVLLGWGMWRRRPEILRLAMGWLVILCAVSIGIKFTGDEAAEEAAVRLAESKTHVDRHEQTADQATTGLFLLGVAAIAALLAGRRKNQPPAWSCVAVLLIGIVTGLLLARTANSGGQIGHPELRKSVDGR